MPNSPSISNFAETYTLLMKGIEKELKLYDQLLKENLSWCSLKKTGNVLQSTKKFHHFLALLQKLIIKIHIHLDLIILELFILPTAEPQRNKNIPTNSMDV